MKSSSGLSKYERKQCNKSVYFYKDSEVLVNNENIKDSYALALYEADITMFRQYELEKEQPIRGRYGINHIKRIHRYIFQDIYPFAGKFRIEDIEKGSTFFCKSEYIEENLKAIFIQIKKDRYLKGLNVRDFSQKAAYYLAEINMIHPFREGNGRSTREFFRQLALYCGYIINWSLIDKEILLEATITAVRKDYGPLGNCIFQAIDNK